MLYEAKFYTSTPAKTNKNFINTGKGGYSHCIVIDNKTGYTLANCVAFVHGQWLYQLTEALGLEKAKEYEAKMCRQNAEMYWEYTQDGYERGQTPKKGAIICWRKGKIGSSDGAGHVMIVKEVKSNGDVLCIGSNYGGSKFYTATYKKSNSYYLGSKFTHQGFIYLPIEVADFVTVPVAKNIKVDQVYVDITNLNARTAPTTSAHRQGYAAKGYYDVKETKKTTAYEWYRIDDNLWIADVNGVTFCPKQELKYNVEFLSVTDKDLVSLRAIAKQLNCAIKVKQI